tara:strand:+ start:486 stop:803 length:318 start_codon:yes stop_codon:yes gene_type:complete
MRNISDDIIIPNYHTIEKHDKMFHNDQDCVVLDDEPYDGVIIQYDVVQAYEEKDENGDNIGKFSFNFIICENPNKLDLATVEFKTILGDILQKLLKEHLERAEQD